MKSRIQFIPHNPHPDPLPWKGRGDLQNCDRHDLISSPRKRGEDQGEGPSGGAAENSLL
jgi:hypothetical protein